MSRAKAKQASFKVISNIFIHQHLKNVLQREILLAQKLPSSIGHPRNGVLGIFLGAMAPSDGLGNITMRTQCRHEQGARCDYFGFLFAGVLATLSGLSCFLVPAEAPLTDKVPWHEVYND